MMTASEVAKVLDTILSSPGMNDAVKIDIKISRRNVLVLSQLIKKGLGDDQGSVLGLIDHLPDDVGKEMEALANDCLSKAGLAELSSKLQGLSTK
ncbi:hypothetical protein SIO70_26405 [Chitinophaga sancti]|uniref:hypothetical protein n=1 Tax=Chitinophaga sancti TaxID=1004 RepID=UPI002A763BAB|nr:hypothetical protein [Chitinophaga sancti]WPQ61898.1 hypothetical protein SIO70_26405 [Chitinophaga sancti]